MQFSQSFDSVHVALVLDLILTYVICMLIALYVYVTRCTVLEVFKVYIVLREY